MSTIAWLDHSEKQRRQMLEAIDLFREKDTRDEMGIAGIREAFADMLFPGTGALQTRARYFLFVPWMYIQFAGDRVSSAEVARKSRDFEIALLNRLADSPDPKSTRRAEDFVLKCPEFVIVDEAHGCTLAGGIGRGRQQRFELLRKIAAAQSRHLLLVTGVHANKSPLRIFASLPA